MGVVFDRMETGKGSEKEESYVNNILLFFILSYLILLYCTMQLHNRKKHSIIPGNTPMYREFNDQSILSRLLFS